MYNQSSFQTSSFGASGQKSFTGGNQVASQYRGWQKPYQPTGQVQSVYGQNQQTHFTSGQFKTNPQSYHSTGFPVQSQYGSGVNSFQNASAQTYSSHLGNTAGIGSQGQMTQNYGSALQGYKSGFGTTAQSQPSHSVSSWNQAQQFSHTPAWSQSKAEYTPTQQSQFGYQSWNR